MQVGTHVGRYRLVTEGRKDFQLNKPTQIGVSDGSGVKVNNANVNKLPKTNLTLKKNIIC